MSEEEIMKILKDTISLFNNDTYCFTHSNDERTEAIQGLLDLYNKEKKKNESLIKENLEIRDWKYVIDSPIDLDKLKELDLIKIKGKEYVSKDKIKAKIEELEKAYEDSKNEDGESEYYYPNYTIEVLQSLLAKDLEKCERKD